MKQNLLILIVAASTLLYSCSKEQLIDVPQETNKPATTLSSDASKRMDCEPFGFGMLALNNGTVSTTNMNMQSDIGYGETIQSYQNVSLQLFGTAYVHSNVGNFAFSLASVVNGLLQVTSPEGDWKIQKSNEHAINLSDVYADINPNAEYTNLSGSMTIYTPVNIIKPNTIVNIESINYNNKILTLVGRPSSDDGFIINITGNMSFNNSEVKLINVRPERVLFNFPNATNVHVKSGSKWRGTILSPIGNVLYQNPALFEGSIIAKNINATGSTLGLLGTPTYVQKTYCNGYQWEGDGITCQPTTLEVPLIAGQNTTAGSISVTNDGNNLTVTYTTTNGWKLLKIHLYVGLYSGVPLSGGLNPSPGQFPIHATFTNNNTTTYSHTIPLSSLPECMIIAAHAEVKKGNQTETGWGQGDGFPGANWGMYFSYCQFTCE